MNRFRNLIVGAALAFAALGLSQPAQAAATTQTAHAFMCAPQTAIGAQARRLVMPTTAATVYVLNSDGCVLVAVGDIGYFSSQGFVNGPNIFTLQQTGITASTTASTSTITLPAYGVIYMVVLEETAGNAITGGVDIGDSGSATRFASAVTLGANATVSVADSALTRLFANSGVPVADQILVVCHTACNSGSINIIILYGYF